MSALGGAADEPPRFAVNVALVVGQRLFATVGLGLALEQENGQGPAQGEVARRDGVTDRAADASDLVSGYTIGDSARVAH